MKHFIGGFPRCQHCRGPEPSAGLSEELRDMDDREAFKAYCDGNRAPWVEGRLAAVAYRLLLSSKPDPEREAMVEAVAEECHKQWAGWTGHLLSKCLPLPSGNLILGLEWKDRWMRQVNTIYADLSEPEKESDRREARKILSALNRVRDGERGK